jgi:uncharacterized membrane-anchored protein
MTLKNINLKSLAFAGFVAGYVMYFADKYLAGTLGLFGVYPGTADPWWMLQHHIDAIIFAIPFALPAIQRKLPGSGWLKGTVYGFLWAILVTVIMQIIGALGANLFAQMSLTVQGVVTSLLLHMVYGFTLGALYLPPGESRMIEDKIYRFIRKEQGPPVHHDQ